MSVEYVEFIVEEPSMETLLRHIAPRLLGEVAFNVFPFQSKDELLRELPNRLLGYTAWLQPTHRIVVIVDQDDDDCQKLKRRLEDIAERAGLHTRTSSKGGTYSVVNRIAVEELEAWYFGDWEAVCAAYPRVSRTAIRKRGLRDPDNIRGGTWETFERVMRNAGYFKNGLRKNEVARTVGAIMNVDANTSRSFQALRDALRNLTGE